MKTLVKTKPEEFGIEKSKAENLTKGLSPILEEREFLIQEFKDILDLEISEDNKPKFKGLRLKIVKNRTQGINKWHKTSKEFFLAGGRFVDAIKNKEIQVNEEMESKLLDAEKHFDNIEKERLDRLQKKRAELLSEYVEDASIMKLSEMEEDVWDAYLSTKKKNYLDKIEAEKKAEAERIEEARLDKIENNRRFEIAPFAQFNEGNKDLRKMEDSEYNKLLKSLKDAKKEYEIQQEEQRKENERLKKEREAENKRRKEEEEKRKAIEEERLKKEKAEAKRIADEQAKKQAEHDAQLKKEREVREKLEREEVERKKLEADSLAKEKELKEKLEKAPVKDKLNKWVEDFELPETSVDNDVSNEIKSKFDSFKKWSINQVNNL